MESSTGSAQSCALAQASGSSQAKMSVRSAYSDNISWKADNLRIRGSNLGLKPVFLTVLLTVLIRLMIRRRKHDSTWTGSAARRGAVRCARNAEARAIQHRHWMRMCWRFVGDFFVVFQLKCLFHSLLPHVADAVRAELVYRFHVI